MTGPDMESLVLEYAPTVRRLAVELGYRPPSSAYQDVVSDGLLGLWQAIRTHDPERGELSARVVFRVHAAMVDGLRSRGVLGRPDRGRAPSRPPALPLDLAFHDRPDPDDLADDAVEHADAVDRVAVAVAAARELDARLPLVLNLLGRGWTQGQIGARLGVSRQLVGRLVALARSVAA